MKQELEEVTWELANKLFKEKCEYEPNLSNSQDLLVVSSIQEGIIKGAKWQQKRMLKFILDEDNHTEGELGNSCIDVQTLVYFIEQIKKEII